MNPSEISGLSTYPNVERLFREHLDMQIDDLRAMLRLPTQDFTAGCNFAAASLLMNLLSGFSVVLYNDPDPKMPPATDPGMRGPRLKHLLDAFFPHDPSTEPPKTQLIDVMYTFSRNSLTHALGLRQPSLEPEIVIKKRSLDPKEIGELEITKARPGWLGGTVTVTSPGTFALSVPALYWGTFPVAGGTGSGLWPYGIRRAGVWTP